MSNICPYCNEWHNENIACAMMRPGANMVGEEMLSGRSVTPEELGPPSVAQTNPVETVCDLFKRKADLTNNHHQTRTQLKCIQEEMQRVDEALAKAVAEYDKNFRTEFI